MQRDNYLLVLPPLALLAVPIIVLIWPSQIFAWDYWQVGGATTRSEVVRNLGLLAVGVIGLPVAVWRVMTSHRQAAAAQRQADAAFSQAETAISGQFTDRFTKAIEHLGNEKLSIRLGGIYALWRLVEESQQRDVLSAIDILCAFVRSPLADEHIARGEEVRIDVQAILTLLSGRDEQYRSRIPKRYRLNLDGMLAPASELVGADFSDAKMRRADLKEARLFRANFQKAAINTAKFIGCSAREANFTDIFGSGADFTDADLQDAKFNGALVHDAKFLNANFSDANLTKLRSYKGDFTNAALNDANLAEAYLFGAIFKGANLRSANLSGANLNYADFSGANVQGADFSAANLDSTKWEGARVLGAIWPNAFDPPRPLPDEEKIDLDDEIPF